MQWRVVLIASAAAWVHEADGDQPWTLHGTNLNQIISVGFKLR